MVKLYNEHKDEGLEIVSLSLDLEDGHESALGFLNKQKAVFPNFRLKMKEATDYKDHFKDISGPPVAYVYDREGNLVETYEGADPDVKEDMKKKVEELLAKK